MRFIYGPVASRRLGLSLGLSLTPHKVCSFDCVYCQLGKTTDKTMKRSGYVDVKEVLKELRVFLTMHKLRPCDCISISGFGEPALNTGIAGLIAGIKKITAIPLVLITNSSLFTEPQLSREISLVDIVAPSLDAVTQDVFLAIDNPFPGLKISDIIDGLAEFRKEFKGRIYLEIMLIKGVNDSLDYAYKFKAAIDKIMPDKVQLNTPVRSVPMGCLEPPDKNRLEGIKAILGAKCELI